MLINEVNNCSSSSWQTPRFVEGEIIRLRMTNLSMLAMLRMVIYRLKSEPQKGEKQCEEEVSVLEEVP
jgi:hypothetical protein